MNPQSRPLRTPVAVLGLLTAVLCATVVPPTRAQSPAPGASPGSLTVAGVGERPVTLAIADLRALPRTTVTTEDRGKTLTHEGVLIADVLKRAGASGGHGHGSTLTTYVVATARDGYQVVFSMGELDPAISPSLIVVADTLNGKPLPDDVGPFRIVAPKDLHGSRGVRSLERLEVMSATH